MNASIHPWCAYKHATLDGCILYVGKVRLSRSTDLAPSRRSAYHLASIKKHCVPFLVIAVQPFQTESEAFEAERRWIAEAKADGNKLCNFTDGGEGVSGRTVSAETREKIRAATLKQWDRQGRASPKARPSGVCQCVVCGCDIAWKGRSKLLCSRRCTSEHYRAPYIPHERDPGVSGIRGVYPSANGKWKAGVTVAGVYRHLGTFPSKEAAASAVKAAL